MKDDEPPAPPGLLEAIKAVARWVVPFNIYMALIESKRERLAEVEPPPPPPPPALAPNAEVKDRHRGGRCFILANGPSVRNQNLALLRGETVISVSNGYLHRDFDAFRPLYHCVPQLTYSALPENEAVEWFREMHARIGNAELFLSLSEEPLVKKHGLFPGRAVRYLALQEHFEALPDRALIDISRPVPTVQSVPVMALMVAMYMGFERIYLLGVDHDHFRTGEYVYAFEPTVLKGKDPTVGREGKVTTSLYEDFEALNRLWRQYRRMREIAAANGISILNATAGGALDEFPRVRLEDALAK